MKPPEAIRDPATPPPKRRRRLSPAWSIVAALALVALTVGLRFAVGYEAGSPPLLIFFIIPITASAFLGGLIGGLAATFASAIVAAWLFIPPGGFGLETGAHLDNWLGLCGGGALFSLVFGSLDGARRRAEEHERALCEIIAQRQRAEDERAAARLREQQATEATRDAERALRDKDALLRAFSDAIPDPIFMKDRESRILFANPGTLAVLGHPAEEVLGRSDLEIYQDRELAAALIAADRRIMESGHAEVLEEIVPSAEGTRTFLSTKVPYRDEAGEVIGVIGTARDITDRKRVEEALRHREAYYRALIEKSSDITVILDAQARIRFWSPAATEQLGWTAEEMEGRDRIDLVPEEDRAAVRERFLEFVKQPGATIRFVRRQLHKDGSIRVVEVHGRNLLHDPAVEGVVTNLRDITEQRRLTEQFQHAQKLESVARLAGGVAHDFNNLLTVVLTCSEALKDDLDHGVPANVEDVEAIRAAGERARDLTRQLLAFARRQIVAPVALDVNGLLRGSQKMLGRLLGEDVELRVDLAPGLWTTVADPGQMEQVLLNLCVNARDAMPRGGTITIATRNVSVDEMQAVSGDELLAGEWVEMSVRDTGVGMTPEVKAHLFEPFFTTKEQGKGTGLGLASIYGIVRQAGGHMHVESEPGHGATFTVHLPRAIKAVHEPRAHSTARAEGGSETILLAEDEAPVRNIITRSLQAAGYRVLAAGSGKAALGLAAAERGPIHLVLTDVVMPELDGRALVEELRKHRSGFQVLYMSGYTHDIIGHHGVLDSGVELLAKPFTAVALLERVRAILDAAPRG